MKRQWNFKWILKVKVNKIISRFNQENAQNKSEIFKLRSKLEYLTEKLKNEEIEIKQKFHIKHKDWLDDSIRYKKIVDEIEDIQKKEIYVKWSRLQDYLVNDENGLSE